MSQKVTLCLLAKMTKIFNYSKIYIVSLSVILMILAYPWSCVQCLFAEQRLDSPDESVPGAYPEQTDPGDSADKFVLNKISCVYIIREDYDGLGLSYPSRLFVDPVKKEIYITDSGRSRILVYTHDYYPLITIGKSDGVEVPVGLAVDPKGYLFVAQSPSRKHQRGRISVLNPCLRWKRDIFFDGFEGAEKFHPNNIAINDEGRLYVTGIGFRGVVVLNREGTFSHLLTPTDKLGKGEEERATICDVDIDDSGRIYLLSEDMGRIYVYDRQERFLFKFGQKGGSSGKLSRPRGLAVDSRTKRIYVIDYMRHTASAYSDKGHFLFEFGGFGWAKGWFQYPNDIGVDTMGNVLIADTFNNRVQVLGISTSKLDTQPKPDVMVEIGPLASKKERQRQEGLEGVTDETESKDRPAFEETQELESKKSIKEIKKFVYSWRAAWQAQEIERYISHYDEEFSSGDMDLHKWSKYKERLFRTKKIKNIVIEDMKITQSKDLVIVCFLQRYVSDKYTDIGKKYLYLKRRGNRWKIIQEKWVSQ